MKLQIWHAASSAVIVIVMRDAEIRIPFCASSPAHVPAVPPPLPPGLQCVASDEIRLVMSLV